MPLENRVYMSAGELTENKWVNRKFALLNRKRPSSAS